MNNDGVVDYTSKNPSHTYKVAGTYTVKLTVTNSSGSDSEIKSGYIRVTSIGVLSVPSSAINLTDFGIKGDGSDETAKLKSAFDYVRSYSIKTVIFPANKVIGINNYIETPENIELVGNGCTIKLLNNAAINHEMGFFYLHAGSYAHNLIFDGNMNNQGGTATNGVMVYENAEFAYNEVKNVGAYTVFTYLSDYAYIHDNLIHDSWQYGISTGGTTTPYKVGIRIQNNTIYNCEEVGIKIKGADGAIISGNTVTMPTESVYPRTAGQNALPIGIHLYSADEPNKNIVITGNTVIGIAGASWNQGIGSSNSLNPGCKITNNILKNVQNGIDIHYSNSVITGNTISYYDTGITDSGSGNTKSGNTVTKL
jgi:parallel beta-helix repeat protein